LIVVADHETGGLTLIRPATTCDTLDEGPFAISGSSDTFCTDFSTSGHTGVNVPLTAMGSDSGYLSGTHENTDIFTTMRRYLTAFEYNYLPLVKMP
jgi:alkaline phosphatase